MRRGGTRRKEDLKSTALHGMSRAKMSALRVGNRSQAEVDSVTSCGHRQARMLMDPLKDTQRRFTGVIRFKSLILGVGETLERQKIANRFGRAARSP